MKDHHILLQRRAHYLREIVADLAFIGASRLDSHPSDLVIRAHRLQGRIEKLKLTDPIADQRLREFSREVSALRTALAHWHEKKRLP